MNIEDLRKYYNSVGKVCVDNAKIVVQDGIAKDIYDKRCMKWHCKECRKVKKYMLFLEVLINVYNFGLDKHFIITFGGKEKRDKYNIKGYCDNLYDAFTDMSSQWNMYKKSIDYYLVNKEHAQVL